MVVVAVAGSAWQAFRTRPSSSDLREPTENAGVSYWLSRVGRCLASWLGLGLTNFWTGSSFSLAKPRFYSFQSTQYELASSSDAQHQGPNKRKSRLATC